ncbi:MAG: 50S ribosomal protein L11 methyltransferase [Bdellovibrionales bacterium]|nr:50S ribosomal protein L11 methyltransferase [Bdellovibrionales bacterium]
MGQNYIRIRLFNLSKEQEDILTTHSFECGASGVSEALKFMQPDLTYDPRVIDTNHHEIDVFFPERPGCQFFDGIIALDNQIQWQIFEEETKDWLEEWKKGFKAFKLVDSFWIVPSWEPIPENCKNPIFIDPGMAFGTGTHATTQMASYFLNKFSKKTTTDSLTFLDVGTGTGILAIMADQLAFNSVTGIEIDPEARRVATENCQRNKATKVSISEKMIEEIKTPYDVVIANIIDGVLVKIRKDLLRVTKNNGNLFLTGILKGHEDAFIKDFIEASPVKIELRIEKDEWIGFWLSKCEDIG